MDDDKNLDLKVMDDGYLIGVKIFKTTQSNSCLKFPLLLVTVLTDNLVDGYTGAYIRVKNSQKLLF
jgi:hypothetical protein